MVDPLSQRGLEGLTHACANVSLVAVPLKQTTLNAPLLSSSPETKLWLFKKAIFSKLKKIDSSNLSKQKIAQVINC